MPEMTFTVRWPDGTVEECYSPSLVMHDHLATGSSYTVVDFVARTTTALDEASRRVAEKYGFACTSAIQQSGEIAERSARHDPVGLVTVIGMTGAPVRTSA